MKIEKGINGYPFKITTPDGVMYYFGGSGAVEQNKKTSSCGKAFDIWVTTAWYLQKIVSPLGQEINFSYTSVYYNYLGSAQESIYLDAIGNSGSCSRYAPQSRACQSTYSVLGVVLQQISSTQAGTINISYINQSYSADVLFKSIIVADINNVVKKDFEFTYNSIGSTLFSNLFGNVTSRDFLNSFSEISTNSMEAKNFVFSYNNLNQLPVFNTFATDTWGFFNGKSNSHFVQRPDDPYTQSLYPNATANRDCDYQYALKGLLSKIQYPTKGYDTIIYEGNTYGGTKSVPPPITLLNKSVTGTSIWTQVASSTSVPITYAQSSAQLDYSVIDNSGSGQFDTQHNLGSISFTDVNTGIQLYYRALLPDNVLYTQIVYPVSGHTYNLTITANGTVVTTNAILHYRAGNATMITNPPIGGVRVKSVQSYTDNTAVPSTKNYYYALLSALNASSGYGDDNASYLSIFNSRFLTGCSSTTCSHNGSNSYPQNNMATYPGGITYQAVVEGFGNNFENGAIEHTYTVQRDNGPENLLLQVGGDYMPGTTFSNNSYYNGKELTTTTYKNSSGQLLPLEKTEYTYKIDPSKSMDIVGCAVNKRYPYCGTVDISAFDALRYYLYSRWVYPDTIKYTKYDDNGLPAMTSYVKNYYDNPVHMLVSRSETKNSMGDIVTSQTKYSSDFGTLSAADNLTQGIKALNDQYILNAVVENTTFKKDGSGNNQRLLNSKFQSYKASNNKPDVIYQVEQITPLTNFAVANNQSGTVIKDSRYKPQVYFTQYDYLGNITQQNQSLNITISYIWDYQNLYPIAAVNNSDAASIAYTSFEADGKGNWSYTGTPAPDATPLTGTKSYTLNGTNNITKSGLLSTTTYIVSYWTKNSSALTVTGSITGYPVSGRSANGWKYFEHRVTGQTTITVAGNGTIDELRLYPVTAQMSTYTYERLKGMTCQCDPNNRIVYYEYDGLSRLSIVRDQDNNIIKKICYNYMGQPENCSGIFWNDMKFKNYNKSNCTGTGVGSTVTYTVSGGTYSSTISLDDANTKAQNDIDANGQGFADANGSCIFYNVVKTQTFMRTNCDPGYSGSTVTYTVAANTYSSTISQATVDQMATNDLTTQGPNYANIHGTCAVTCNASNCSGAGKACINNVCSTGVKVYTSSVYDPSDHQYLCTYHYEYSDGSWSVNYTEVSSTPCQILN